MNLNQTTAYIGANSSGTGSLSSLVKEISKDEKNIQYTVFLVFDLDRQEIRFDNPEPFENQSVYEYNYFGNNSGAATQYYLTRESKSAGYLLGTVLSDLGLMVRKHGMQNETLYAVLQKLEAAGMIEMADKKGKGTVNLDKLAYKKRRGLSAIVLSQDGKTVEVVNEEDKEQKISIEKIIRDDLEDTISKNKYTLIVPAIITEGEYIRITCHPDYVDLVKREALQGQQDKTTKATDTKICYICGKEKTDVGYEYTKKFSQSRINKIYTTTTINTAPSFIARNYDQVYSICQDCYSHLLTGEKVVLENYNGQMAGENVFIVPEDIDQNFNYNNLQKIKNNVDLAFKANDADVWISQVSNEAELMEDVFYTINIIIYRTDGKSISVLQVIEDVPVLRFTRANEAIAKNKACIKGHLKFMSMGSIYRIIPVRTNKKKEQIDIGRVLTLYKILLAGGTVRLESLYSYAVEALDKGLKQLAKSSFDNYYNMGLIGFTGGKEDFFIKRIIMSYLVLITICQQLGVLQNDAELSYKGGDHLKIPYAPGIEESINTMETFLDGQDFSKEARALFYLGALINRVAVAQLKKEHKTKPILKKISYQGMNNREVYRLYNDVIEKLRQYDKMTLYVEALMNKFHEYAGKTIIDGIWPLSEQANVFYIMSGYAYMVGSKPTDLDKEEKQVLQDIGKEGNEDDNKAE